MFKCIYFSSSIKRKTLCKQSFSWAPLFLSACKFDSLIWSYLKNLAGEHKYLSVRTVMQSQSKAVRWDSTNMVRTLGSDTKIFSADTAAQKHRDEKWIDQLWRVAPCCYVHGDIVS